MNPYKTIFVFMGLIYGGLLTWAVAAGLAGSMAISVCGLLLCLAGWSLADRYL